ncbi:pre-rRNA-processing protein ESF1 [Angomonas deanei]|uniref:ESF1 RRM domain-containing protein n=1 Tax=Angomonas deanei TaxID=59799 RepID=A0A7G2C3I5_9TRYP|nr:pre-rRNA-processing protein ESF1 [Angomonas deanei]CAD2213277.1 hypothetical protein, conserved [Angomonas deanei]|eukprot:EPY42628.1 pre-rRNA-processing protein ESF1 [Angomonas deanei]
MIGQQGEDGEFFSEGKYRLYEKSRMAYYYAVARFDSADTAAAVYNELDGMDIEASGVVLDLRYIDDSEEFTDPPVSRADCIPPNFKPLSSFKSSALTQTKFRISWDQDDVFRHHSVQDSFTGTSAEDDLAAYLAPPDSDDEDNGGTGNAEEKLRIRRKYSALLSEIGGLPDQPTEGEEALEKDSDEEEDDDSDDDDDLNRFSDVELDEEESGENDSNDDDEVREVEATLDLDAGQKAIQLQKETRLKQKLKEGDLASQAALKYKQRRKELKKSKKEMYQQEREMAEQKREEEREQQRNKLSEIMGVDGEVQKLTAKERKKQHARQVKQRLAEERAARKQMHLVNQLGVEKILREKKETKEARSALENIDPRFSSKLLSDPRFNLDVGRTDKRVGDEVVNLAKNVTQARKVKRDRVATPEKPTTSDNSGDDALNFFMNKTKKRKGN